MPATTEPKHELNPSDRKPANPTHTGAIADKNGGGQGQVSGSGSAGGNGPLAGSHAGKDHVKLP